jgi:hypothetical protein
MTIDDEMLMAYADGELQPEEASAVERALAADPSLREALEAQRRLKSKLAAAYAPAMEEALPSRLTSILEPGGEVVDFAAAREKKARPFGWPQLAAMAASLAVGVVAGQLALGSGGGPVAVKQGRMLARGALAETLQTRLASAQAPGSRNRIGISFEDGQGRLCRTFESPELGGIACREEGGWVIVMTAAGAPGASQYRQAGSVILMEQAQAMMADAPLNAEGERRALERGWRSAD